MRVGPARRWRIAARRLGALVALAIGTGFVAGVAAVELAGPAGGVGWLVLGGGALAAGGGWIVARWVTTHLGGARRLVDEVELIATVNPTHRVTATGGAEVEALAAAVNRLAGRFWESISERDAAIAAGRAEAERDRERLATLMAELSHGVVVCDGGGRVLLYNHEASRIFAGGDAGASPAARPASQPLGLGRSIFSLLDRGALTGALHRIELGRSDRHHSRFTAAGPGGQLLRATIGLLGPEAGSTGAGFVMVLDDATGDLVTRDQQSELLLELLEGSRGRLAAISGAVAMLDGYPDLEPAGVARFQAIIAEESARLSTDLADVQQRAQALRATGWEQSDMLCRDLLLAAARQLATGGGLEIAIGDDAGLWARVDAGGVFAALRAVAGDLVASGEVKEIELSCDDNDPFVALRLAWSPGATATSGSAARLAGAQVATGDVAALARRHGTEAWLDRSPAGADQLTVLLPKAAASPPSQGRAPLGGRPTTYDFDLLVAPRAGGDLAACPLGELAYTVFDLETTGLDPAGGDRIVSIGAVRIVNTRLLRHETFDRIVDPERPIPPESAAVHGITSETVRGAATIVEILPDFALFAGETVLVGHNVAFDLRFLQQALPGARGLLDLPVLDTLLLAELAFGEAERHTLEWLGDTLGIDVTGRHTALGDALVTADVFLGLVPLLAAKGWRTLGDVATAAATTSYARLDY